MKKTLKDLLVICDLDNTLLTADMQIPSCNLEMIKLFCTLGGNFTIATGRTYESAREAVATLSINAPVAVCGGAIIVDFVTGKILEQTMLNQSEAMRLIGQVLQRFPNVGIEVMTQTGEIVVVNSSEYIEKHIQDENLFCRYAPLQEIEQGWTKVLFADSPKMLQRIASFVSENQYYQLQPIFTNHIYYEIMPEKATKGQALRTICQKMQIPLENTVAIGDYYNDIELLKTAGYAVAMGNSPAEVKLVADHITGDCQDGGVASYLYHLIKHYA